VVIYEAKVRQKSWAIIQQATTMQSTNLPQPVIGSFNDLRDTPATSQNVDVLMEILDATGAVVSSANPDTLTDTSVTATLIAGNYFLRVSGVGRGDILIDGYSNYASIGQYSISGSAP
jgi:hypothetical protein